MPLHLISVSVERYFLALKVLKIIPILYKPYVDDLNMALKVKKVEEGEGEKLDGKTAREIRELAYSVMPRSVTMEEDFPSNNECQESFLFWTC